MNKKELLSFTINYTNNYNASELRGSDIDKRPWDLQEIILSYSHQNKTLLDVGCGDGHKILPLASSFKNITGIDYSRDMLKAAENNLHATSIENVSFLFDDANKLSFKDETFDVVTCMLSRWDVSELHRVLKTNGMLIVEHLGCNDKDVLKNYFSKNDGKKKRGQYQEYDSETYLKKFEDRFGDFFKIIEIRNGFWRTQYTAKGICTLVYHTPLIRDFDETTDRETLELAIEELSNSECGEGITLTQNRILLVASKK